MATIPDTESTMIPPAQEQHKDQRRQRHSEQLHLRTIDKVKHSKRKRPHEYRSAKGGAKAGKHEAHHPELDDESNIEPSMQYKRRKLVESNHESPIDTSPRHKPGREVPLVDLIVHRRQGKTKALLAEYELMSKPGSRAIITLEDDDQEFNDSWFPDIVDEAEDEWIPLGEPIEPDPLYSEVVLRQN